jgi:hypothetical protein
MGWRGLLLLVVIAVCGPAQVVLHGPGLEIRCTESARGAGVAMLNAWADARARVQAALGLPPPTQTVLELVPDAESLVAQVRASTGSELQGWVAGVALGAEGRMLIRTDSNSGALQRVEGILTHELAHLALAAARQRAQAPPVPRWLDEGLAQVAEGRMFREGNPALEMRAFFHTLLDLNDLVADFPASEGGSALAYAQAEAFVRWLGHQRARGLPEFVALLAEGADCDAAVRAHTGLSLEEALGAFERELRADRSWVLGALLEIGFGAFIAIVCVFAVARFVRRRRELMARMEAEEALAASQTHSVDENLPSDAASSARETEPRPLRRHVVRGFGLRRLKPGEEEPPL